MTEYTTQGVKLQLSNGASTPVFTDIPQIISISGFGTTRSEIDVTDLSDASKAFVLGLKDNGNVQVAVNFDPDDAQHTALRTANNAGTKKTFKLILTDASPKTEYTFDAFVMEFSLDIAVDDVLKATFTLRVSGDIS